MRRTCRHRNPYAVYDFVDGNFLHSKRPAVPGGAWPLSALRTKSLADLQQLWFVLLKERNMLATMKLHYTKHQEELGAMPAPSRLTMVAESMRNVRRVVKERDAAATAAATTRFRARLRRGVYRFPPGPPPPPGAHDTTSVVVVTLAARVDEARLRELFGRYDVVDAHKGIVRVQLRLPRDVLQRKEAAEQAWRAYMNACSDTHEYQKWREGGASVYDYAHVELAPGVYAGGGAAAGEGKHNSNNNNNNDKNDNNNNDNNDKHNEDGDIDDVIVAAALPVPPPQTASSTLPRSTLERLKYERRSVFGKAVVQLPYFPTTTMTPPPHARVGDVVRPTHPDEIAGPWLAVITYDRTDGFAYASSLGITRIDGVDVLDIAPRSREQHDDKNDDDKQNDDEHDDDEHDDERGAQPYAHVDVVYQEALRREQAEEAVQMSWPHVPEWRNEYRLYTRKRTDEIVSYNYSNVVDYLDREVLLTGRSVWEMPITVDATCGGAVSVPAHAKPPKRYMHRSIDDVGYTDI